MLRGTATVSGSVNWREAKKKATGRELLDIPKGTTYLLECIMMYYGTNNFLMCSVLL